MIVPPIRTNHSFKFSILFLFVITLCFEVTAAQIPLKVAIVGSGIGGSSSAYYLKQALSEAVDITIYEKSSITGGRIAEKQFTVNDKKFIINVGADAFFIKNYHIVDLIKEFGLSEMTEDASLDQMGIWNGKEFMWKEGSSQFLSALSFVWRYGFNAISFPNTAQDVSDQFIKQYENETGWSSISEWVQRTSLAPYLNCTMEEYFQSQGFSQIFIDEIISGITRTIYQQDATSIHSLAGLIAIIGIGGGELFSIKHGNTLLVNELLKRTDSVLKLNEEVISISRNMDDTYTITSRSTVKKEEHTNFFDVVILAVPHSISGIALKDITPPPSVPYVLVYVTVIYGLLNPSYFGETDIQQVPTTIISKPTPPDHPNWTVLYVNQRDTDNQLYFYKSFSSSPLDNIQEMFSVVKDVVVEKFYAYPFMPPDVTLAPIKLAPYLYYPSAFDTVVACVEGSLISAKNIIKLVVHDLKSHPHRTSSFFTKAEL